jgi:hypothetical protein
LAICAFAAPAAFADEIQYAVTVNTSSENGQYGYIDLQFNPGLLTTQGAFAQVTNFTPAGALNAADPNNGTTGDVTGSLPGPLTFDNGQTTNEYTEGLTFGDTITFDVDLYGSAVGSTANGEGGGIFTLDFLDPSGNYLFTADPVNDVPVATVDINTDGSTTVTTFASDAEGDPSVASFTQVPEPSMGLLLAGGLAAIAALRRRRGC